MPELNLRWRTSFRAAACVTEIAYDESAWFLHFLEAQKGPGSIAALLAAFRKGEATEGALRKVSFSSVADFETGLKSWTTLPAAKFWHRPVVRDGPEVPAAGARAKKAS